MSRTLFYVKLKSYTGKSPQDFIRVIRLERAATMLRGGRSVTDAAAQARANVALIRSFIVFILF